MNIISHEIAKQAHAGQKYGDRDYLNYHVAGVVDLVSPFLRREDSGFNSTNVYIPSHYFEMAAWLHDSVEDSDLTLQDLRNQGIPEAVVKAVGLMTKPEDFDKEKDLENYLEAISQNDIARVVKKADITFNMTSCLEENRLEKAKYYFDQLALLSNITAA